MFSVKDFVLNFLSNYVQGAYQDAIKCELDILNVDDDIKDKIIEEFDKYIVSYSDKVVDHE